MRQPAWYSLLLVIPSALLIWAALEGRFPLGVPGEWTWERIEPAATLGLLAFPALTAFGYMAWAWLGAQRVEKSGRIELWSWLAGLVAAGFLWLWVAQEAAPPGYQLSKAAWVLYYKGSSGYFTQAREQAQDLGKFLGEYESHVAEGDVLHIGTHPPGLVVCFRGLIRLCEDFPGLTRLLLQTQPDSVRRSFDLIEQNSRRSPTPFVQEARAVLWLAALLVQLVAAATVLPLYGLLRNFFPARVSWLAASFWPATLALALFLPKSDALYPFLGTLFLLLWLEGWQRRQYGKSLAAGFVLWLGMGLSLALLPVVCLAMIITVRDLWLERTGSVLDSCKRIAPALLWGALGFLVPCAATWFVTGMNLFNVWAWNLRNHEAFYSSFSRTYWKWLLVNPLELAIAGGLPLAILAVWSAVRETRQSRSPLASTAWGIVITWGLLWLSGKNMGEAARLWIVIMPWLILLAAPLLSDPDEELIAAGKTARDTLIRWGVTLTCQFAITAVLATRIVGFHVPMPAP